MRFTEAWYNLAQTNSYLKILAVLLSISLLGFTLLILKLSHSPPLFIERACESKSLEVKKNLTHTESEIKEFLSLALKARFNSRSEALYLISKKEQKRRALEQRRFLRQGIRQKVLIEHENIKINGGKAVVLSDRLISVRNIRSAFLFPLKVSFSKVKRTLQNPYGLVLVSVSEITDSKPSKKRK